MSRSAGFKRNPMKTSRLLAAASAAMTLCVATSAFAGDDPPSANGDYVYDGKMPPVSERGKGKTPRENTHMQLTGAQKYGRQPVVASVDQWRNNRRQIDVTFTE